MAQLQALGRVSELFRYPVKSLGGEARDSVDVLASGFAGDRLWAFRDIGRDEISSAKRNPGLLQITAKLREDGHAELAFPSGETLHTDLPECAARVSSFIGRPQLLCGLRPASDTAHFARENIAPEKFEAHVRELLGLQADEPLPDFSQLPREALTNATLPGTYFDAAPLHVVLVSELENLKKVLPGAGIEAARFRPNIVLDDRDAPLSAEKLIGAKLRVGTAEIATHWLVPRCSMTTHAQGALPKAPEIMRKLVRDWKHNFGIYGSVAKAGQIRQGDVVAQLN